MLRANPVGKIVTGPVSHLAWLTDLLKSAAEWQTYAVKPMIAQFIHCYPSFSHYPCAEPRLHIPVCSQ